MTQNKEIRLIAKSAENQRYLTEIHRILATKDREAALKLLTEINLRIAQMESIEGGEENNEF